jgi:hypothetical protein
MKKSNASQLTDPRTARHLNTDEDYREITFWFRKSFKPYARLANRKGRRAARRLLRNLEA